MIQIWQSYLYTEFDSDNTGIKKEKNNFKSMQVMMKVREIK